jgi:hypothetical protein
MQAFPGTISAGIAGISATSKNVAFGDVDFWITGQVITWKIFSIAFQVLQLPSIPYSNLPALHHVVPEGIDDLPLQSHHDSS